MAVELTDLVRPGHTVLVTMECQRGIVGDLSGFPELVAAAEAVSLVANGARLVRAARAAGVRVVHCTAETRRDGAGGTVNCRLLAAADTAHARGGGIEVGSPGAQLVPELGPEPVDLVVPRLHGVTPFTGTSLDQLIRNLDATTVVAIGVSLNVGLLGLVLSAVDLGYQAVVPADAVTGVPVSYGRDVLDGTISLLATVTTVDELCAVWAGR